MTEPADISARYHEVQLDDNDDRGTIIKDRATGETCLVLGDRRWQQLVLRSLNIADEKLERIEPERKAAL